MRFRSLPLICILALTFVFGAQAKAVSVSPAIEEISVDAGSQKEFSVLVTNDEPKTVTYAITIQKFIPEGDNGRVQFLSPQNTDGLPNWIYLDASTLTLRSGESKKLSVSLRVPQEAIPGGHYAALFLTQTSLDVASGQNVSAVPRIGILVFATVNGAIVERLSLNNAYTEQVDSSHFPVRFVVDVGNQGSVHVQPSIRIDVTNLFGQTVATIDGNASKGRVLPGSKRIYTADWSKEGVSRDGSFFEQLKQEWNDGAIGWYQAKIQVASRVGSSGNMVVHFQIWPWRVILVGSGIVLFIVCILSIVIMRRRRQIKH